MFQLILGMIPCCFQDQTTTLSQQFCTDTAQILHVIRFEVRADNDVGLCKNDSSPKFGDVDRELRVSNSNVILFGMSHSQLPQPHAPHGRLWMLLPCRFRGHKIPIWKTNCEKLHCLSKKQIHQMGYIKLIQSPYLQLFFFLHGVILLCFDHWKSSCCAYQAAPLLDCFSGPLEASLFPEHLCCDAEQWPPSGWWKCGWAGFGILEWAMRGHG